MSVNYESAGSPISILQTWEENDSQLTKSWSYLTGTLHIPKTYVHDYAVAEVIFIWFTPVTQEYPVRT